MTWVATLVAEGWTQAEIDRRKRVERGGSVVANCSRRACDRRLIAWANEEELFVYVGRGGGRTGYCRSDWHNPTLIVDTHDARERAWALASYESHLDARPDLLARLEGPELRGKVLGCHCYPLGCHGGILVARLDAAAGLADG
jgi:hypothetical protein